MPLAVAALAHAQAPTEVAEPAGRPASSTVEGLVERGGRPGAAGEWKPPSHHSYRPTAVLPDRYDAAATPSNPPSNRDGITRPLPPEPVPVRPVTGAERLRRSVFELAGLVGVAGAVAWAPYLAVIALALLAWLLRSGTMAAEAAGVRRQLRGLKWYDGLQTLLAAPWHAVRALPGTLLLVGWSAGLAAAAALMGYALAAAESSTLLACGFVFGLGMWWGPGSDRLRAPVRLLTRSLSVRPVPWLIAALLSLALGSGLVAAAASYPTNWAPASARPFADVSWPAFLEP